MPSPTRAAAGLAILFAGSAVTAEEQRVAETTGAEVRGGQDTIVVTATRSERRLDEVPVSISVQDLEDRRALGFTFGTDEFRGVPGVSFRRGEGDGDFFPFVAVRGSPGTDGFLALIDGVPFVGIFEEPLLAEVPYDALERVEIVRGPLSALYGRGALYGAVNYITRSPQEPGARVSIAGGSDGYFRTEGSATLRPTDTIGVLVGGAHEDFEGWRENSRRRLTTVFGKADFAVSADTDLGVTGIYLERFAELPNGIPLDQNGRLLGPRQPFRGFGQPQEDLSGGIVAARLQHRFSENLSLNLLGQYRQFDRENFLNFYDPFGLDASRRVFGVNGFRGETFQRVWFGEGSLEWQRGAHTIIAGASYEYSRGGTFNLWSGQNGFTFECGFTFFLAEIDWETGEVVNRNHPCFVLDVPLTRSRLTDRFVGLFIQDEWRLTETFKLTLGGRYDSFRRTTVFDPLPDTSPGGTLQLNAEAFSPKAALSYEFDRGLVWASYARGFNSNFGPVFENDPARFDRPETKPTTLDSFEIGVRARNRDRTFSIEAIAFHSIQRNRRVSIPNPDAAEDPSLPSNRITFGQRYEVTGVELSLAARPTRTTDVAVRYSLVDPVWRDFELQTFGGPVDLSGTTPVGVARNTLYIEGAQRIGDAITLRGTFELYDDYFITLDNRVRGGAYELVTLAARIEPPRLPGLSLDLVVLNLFDAQYESFFGGRLNPTYATPGAPRQFRAILSKSF